MAKQSSNPGCLPLVSALLDIISRLRPRGPVPKIDLPIQLPPPPATYGVTAPFCDDTAAIIESRGALAEYRELYNTYPLSRVYPLRELVARQTGLPTFLTGFIEPVALGDAPDLGRALEQWFGDSRRVRALFGTMSNPLREVSGGAVFLRPADDREPVRVHVPYEQWFQHWPVFGGGCVVHLISSDPRASVTSSYFPIHSNVHFQENVPLSDARAIAALAVAERLAPSDAADLLGTMVTSLSEMVSLWERRLVTRFVQRVSTTGRGPRLKEIMNRNSLPALDAPQAEWYTAVQPFLAGQLRRLELNDWTVSLVGGMDRGLVVLPFVGMGHYDPVNHNYHLAYQVCFHRPPFHSWRVFVDAQTGDLLGQPDELSAAAEVRSVSDGSGPALPVPNTIDNEVQPFARLEANDGTPIGVGAFAARAAGDLTKEQLDAAHVAVHSALLFQRFQQPLGMDDASVRRIPVRCGVGGTQFVTHFSVFPGTDAGIVFQTDPGNGLPYDNGSVHDPSRDPEVIYHEFAHAFMWMQNEPIWMQSTQTVPFARALLEGYANYFARSAAAALNGDTGSTLWARGAYRAEYGDLWDLARPRARWVVGQDLLPAPNIYPDLTIGDLSPYHVGMIWARALWEIRTRLQADATDRVALGASVGLRGLITDLAVAAENVLNAAITSTNLNENEIQALKEAIEGIFSARVILARRAINALENVGGVWFVARGSGVWCSSNNGSTWSRFGTPGPAADASRVVALYADGGTLYAATQQQVYRTGTNAPSWNKVGNDLLPQQSPLSLAVLNGVPYVGIGNGVLALENGRWSRWENDLEAFEDPVVSLTMLFSNNAPHLYAANLRSPRHHTEINGQFSTVVAGQLPANVRVMSTAIAGNSSTLFMGTATAGIWSLNLATGQNTWMQRAAPNSSAAWAVRGLHWDGTELWAATTAGICRGTNLLPGPTNTTCVRHVGGVTIAGGSDGRVYVDSGSGAWVAHDLP